MSQPKESNERATTNKMSAVRVRTTSEWYGRRGRARGPGAVFCSDEQTKRFGRLVKAEGASLPRLWAYRAFAVGAGALKPLTANRTGTIEILRGGDSVKATTDDQSVGENETFVASPECSQHRREFGRVAHGGCRLRSAPRQYPEPAAQGHPPLRLGGRCLLRRKDPRLLAGSEKLKGAIFRGDRQPQRPRLPALRHGFDDKAFGCFAHADILATKAGGSIASGGRGTGADQSPQSCRSRVLCREEIRSPL